MSKRKEEIRQQAREQRELRLKKERRSKNLFRLGVTGSIVAAIVVIVAIVLVSTNLGKANTPANLASGGVRFEAGSLIPVSSPASEEFKITTQPLAEDAVDVRIYVDYLCPFCNQFELTYGKMLNDLVASGDIDLEYHPISILDRLSVGTKFSTRAAAASACVAEHQPDKWSAFNETLFANQPAENTEGLNNTVLVNIAKDVQATEPAVEKCITDGENMAWVTQNTKAALEEIPFINQGLSQTPTIVVNGKLFDGSEDFASYIDLLTKEQ